MAMTVIAAYDVSSDSRRSRLAAILQTVGDRIQKSVFVLTLDEADLQELRAEAMEVLDPDVDSLYFFRQCATCWDSLECLGQAHAPQRTLYWAVL